MKSKIVALLALTLFVSACSKQTIVFDGSSKEMARNDVFFSEEPFDPNLDASSKRHDHFFIGGLAQGKAINPAKVCGSIDKVAKVETQQTFLNGLLSALTFSIYAPREVRVYCK
tara:strand:- start:533 stop:874 length:342 start_codon:yes stop_codon:yes gene_type:complete